MEGREAAEERARGATVGAVAKEKAAKGKAAPAEKETEAKGGREAKTLKKLKKD